MQQIVSIQALRALAAAMVVFQHAQSDAGLTALGLGLPFERIFLLPWAAGVDLFFVVSGFVMVFSSEKMFAAPGGTGAFLRRRIARVAPLYWLATTIFLVAVLRGASAGKAPPPSVGEIVSSYAFLPWPRALDGAPRPIHSLGWTLEYEMFFYLVFACFLWFSRTRAVASVTALLGALVAFNVLAAPQNVALAFWSDPIVLEFALGMGIALLYRAGVRLKGFAVAALIVPAALVLAFDPMHSADEYFDAVTPNGFLRLFAWGVPMAAVFAASTLGAAAPGAANAPGPAYAPMRALAKIGDASYALYLFHPLALIVLRKAWLAAGLAQSLGFWPLVVASTCAAIALALVIHVWVETPMTKVVQRWLSARAKTIDARPAASQA